MQALVNCSGIPQVRDELIAMNAVRRCVDALRGGWLEGRADLAHWHVMLIANITSVKAGQEALCDEAMLSFLLAAYFMKPRLPPRDGYDDPMLCIGKAVCNMTAIPEGRKLLAGGDSEQVFSTLAVLVAELADRERRPDVLAIFRNLCADKDCHAALVKVSLMATMAHFLCPWDKAPQEKRDTLPEDLRASLEGSALAGDVSTRCTAAHCIVGLCQTEAGRDYLKRNGCYEVMRAWHLEETDEDTKQAIEVAVPAVHLTEEQLQEDKQAADKQAAAEAVVAPADATEGQVTPAEGAEPAPMDQVD